MGRGKRSGLVTASHVSHERIENKSSNKVFDALASNTSLCALEIINSSFQPEILRKLTTLERISITKTPCLARTDGGMESLASLPNLQEIHLDTCSITNEMCIYFPNFQKLKFLNVNNNCIGDIGLELITQNTHITSLNLSSNSISFEGIQHISKLTCLESLEIGRVHHTAHSLEIISKLPNIRILKLPNTQIITQLGFLTNLKILTELDLSGNRLDTNAVSSIGFLSLLQNLNLNCCFLEDVQIIPLQSLCQLHTLQLSQNLLGDYGAQIISKIPSVTHLDLSEGNRVGDVGAAALALMPNLFRLYLRANKIGLEGALKLAQTQSVVALDLRGNQINEVGADALSQNTHFTTLILEANPIASVEKRNPLNVKNNLVALQTRRNRVLSLFYVLLDDHRNPQSESYWKILPKEILLYLLGFLSEPFPYLQKDSVQIQDCLNFMWSNFSELKKQLQNNFQFRITEKIRDGSCFMMMRSSFKLDFTISFQFSTTDFAPPPPIFRTSLFTNEEDRILLNHNESPEQKDSPRKKLVAVRKKKDPKSPSIVNPVSSLFAQLNVDSDEENPKSEIRKKS
jgi:Leucine-rich repeat (LRR) protein